MPRKGENIYRRKDGRWEGRYLNGRYRNGRKQYSSVYGKSYKEVKQKLIDRRCDNDTSDNSNIRFKDAAEHWKRYERLKVKRSTYENYAYILSKHIIPFVGNIKMKELENCDVTSFINEKLTNGRLNGKGGLSKKYMRDIITIVKSIAFFCENEYGIQSKVSRVGIPKLEKTDTRILSEDEYRILSKYLIENYNPKNLGILIGMYAGLRVGEVCGLKWEDFDATENILCVRRSVQRISNGNGSTILNVDTPKTDSSIRSIPLPDFIGEVLNKHKMEDNIPIISNNTEYVEPNVLRKYFYNVLEKCSIPKLCFHDLRHSFATRCIQLEFDIKSLSEILGHSNVSITLNRYVHSSMTQKRKFMNTFKF